VLKGELLFGVVTFLAAAFLLWVTGNFTGQGTQMGPTYWPRILLTFLMLFSAIVSANAIRRISRENGWSESLLTMDKGKVRLFAAIAMIIAYFILLRLMGFIIVTPLFMIAFMALPGEKSKASLEEIE